MAHREFFRGPLPRLLAGAGLVLGLLLSLATMAVALPLTASAAPQAVSARGGVDDFRFSSFEGEYTLGRDANGNSTMRAVETFVAEFPDFDQNRGIIRAIPDGYLGVNVRTRIVSVTDADGAPVVYDDSEFEDGFILLSLGTDDYVHGTQSYVITYEQVDVVRAFADTQLDEFYWDAPGTGWSQSFDRAQVRVVVDDNLARQLADQNACYVGVQGSDTSCVIEVIETAGSGAVLATEWLPLGPAATVSVAVGFEKGTFVTPEIPSTWPVFLWAPIGAGAAGFAAIVTAIVARRRSAGDAPGRGIIVPQYQAPNGIDLFVAGDVIGKTDQAVPAQIIALAVRGSLRIAEYEEWGFFGARKRYRLELFSADDASPIERELLATFFGTALRPGTVVELSEKDPELTKAVGHLVEGAPRRSVAAGFRARKTVRGLWPIILLAIAAVVAGIGAFVGALVVEGFNACVLIGFLVAIGTIILVAFLARPRKALTDSGAELRDYLAGLRDYLHLAERDRIRMLQSPEGAERVLAPVVGAAAADGAGLDRGERVEVLKLYEKLLPYAILWGIEKEWTEVLGDYYATIGVAPYWYLGSNGFSPVGFAASLNGFSSASGSATPWSASAQASSSGGSGGGGFAGGGGGGGGGGGR